MSIRFEKPSFFKVLLGDFAKRLRIPSKFTKHISMETNRVAILQSRKGRYWKVEIRKNGEGTFLWNGWEKFVRDHFLKEHDFLVFQYDGDLHFSVIIFDKSACEREYKPETKRCKKLSISQGRDDLTRPVEGDLDSGNLIRQNTIPESHQGMILPTTMLKKHSKIPKDGDVCSIRMPSPDAKCNNDYSCHRLIAIHQESSKALEAAKSFNSMFPYFFTRMTPSKVSNRYRMFTPLRFSRELLPQSRTEIVLRGPCGKSWPVVYNPSWRDYILPEGWSNFVHGNNLEEGDYCVFELVGKKELRVTIFRDG